MTTFINRPSRSTDFKPSTAADTEDEPMPSADAYKYYKTLITVSYSELYKPLQRGDRYRAHKISERVFVKHSTILPIGVGFFENFPSNSQIKDCVKRFLWK